MIRLFFYTILIFSFSTVYANTKTIICTGEGNTKKEAVISALHYAISSVDGAFISSKSTLTTDDIFTDNIAMLTNGVIKSFKELSYKQGTPNIIELLVTVNDTNADVNYVIPNSETSVYINGKELIYNKDISELNHKSFSNVIDNYIYELSTIANIMYDYSLYISEPIIKRNKVYIDISVSCNSNNNIYRFKNEYNKSLEYLHAYVNCEYSLNNYTNKIQTLYRTYCYNFTIADNLGNTINGIYSDKALIEHCQRICCEKYSDGNSSVYLTSNKLSIYRNRFPLLNNGNITFTVQYTLEEFRQLTKITINHK